MSIFTTTLRFKIMLAAALLATVAGFGSSAYAGGEDEDSYSFDLIR